MLALGFVIPFRLVLFPSRLVLRVAEDVAKPKETPPEFHVQMRDLNIHVGEPATFDCQVSGYPRPEVYWCKVRFIVWPA